MDAISPAEPHRSLRWIAAGAAAVLLALYVPLLFAPAAGTYHDDGVYLVTAKALAEGRGYRILSLPAEPLQTKYPILFPWLLSLVWRASSFPANLPALRLVPLSSLVIWLLLTWQLIRRYGASVNQSALVMLMTLASPWTAFLSSMTLSETTFAALLTGGLLLLDDVARLHALRAGAAGVLMGASLLTRAAGVAPLGAGLVVLCVRRRLLDVLAYVVGALIVAGPWFYWVATQGAAAAAIDTYNSGQPYASWNIVMSYGLSDKGRILALNAHYVLQSLTFIWGLGWLPLALADAAALAFVALAARGMWALQSTASVAVCLTYLAMVVAWTWFPLRFLMPVVPLLLWFAVRGGRRSHLAWVAAVGVFVVSVTSLVNIVVQSRLSGVTWAGVPPPDDWRSMTALFEWIKRNTSPDAVLGGNLDPAYYLNTDRKAVRAFDTDPFLLDYSALRGSRSPIGTRDDFVHRLVTARVDYLIITPSQRFRQMLWVQEFVREVAGTIPGGLVPVQANFDPGYVIYRVDRVRLTGG